MSKVIYDEERVKELEKEINTFIYYKNDDVSKKILALREKVLLVHAEAESLLHYFYVKWMASYFEEPSMLISSRYIYPFLQELDFLPLIRAFKKCNLMTKEEYNILEDLNGHRRCFSHPNGHQESIKEYEDENKYIETLVVLKNSMGTIVSIWKRMEDLTNKRNILKQIKLKQESSNPRLSSKT